MDEFNEKFKVANSYKQFKKKKEKLIKLRSKLLTPKVERFVRTNVRTGVFTLLLLRKVLDLPVYFFVKAQSGNLISLLFKLLS